MTFKVNFLHQKLSKSIFFFIEEYQYGLFLTTSIFKALYFLKWRSFFDGIYTSVCKTYKNFIGQVIVLEHKGRPCKMCDSVQQKLGHTKCSVHGNMFCVSHLTLFWQTLASFDNKSFQTYIHYGKTILV